MSATSVAVLVCSIAEMKHLSINDAYNTPVRVTNKSIPCIVSPFVKGLRSNEWGQRVHDLLLLDNLHAQGAGLRIEPSSIAKTLIVAFLVSNAPTWLATKYIKGYEHGKNAIDRPFCKSLFSGGLQPGLRTVQNRSRGPRSQRA